jgi:hypothetical protein
MTTPAPIKQPAWLANAKVETRRAEQIAGPTQFHGNPCQYGHTLRYVKGNACVECMRLRKLRGGGDLPALVSAARPEPVVVYAEDWPYRFTDSEFEAFFGYKRGEDHRYRSTAYTPVTDLGRWATQGNAREARPERNNDLFN